MAHDIDLVLLYTYDDPANPTQLQWIIWPDVITYPRPVSISDYDEISNYKEGSLVMRNNVMLYCMGDIIPKAFSSSDWEELHSRKGYVPAFSSTEAYAPDTVVSREIDSTDQFFISRQDVPVGAWDIALWEQITNDSVIESATVYTENSFGDREVMVISGRFMELGGYPSEPNPGNAHTFAKQYFGAGRGGLWYRPSVINSMFQDVGETIPVTASGDRIAVILDQSGNGVDAVQTDDNLRPTYQVDDNGKGYILFSGLSHFNITTTETSFTRLEGIPAIGEFKLDAQAVTSGVFRFGPTSPDADKTWYTAETILITEALSTEEIARFKIYMRAFADSYIHGDVNSLDHYWAWDTTFNLDISDWILNGIINLTGMFQGCTAFNQDLSAWDVSAVNIYTRMFRGCESLTTGMENWDMARAQLTNGMFEGCTLFNADLSNWDTGTVRSMDGMFAACPVFDRDLSKWDTGKVQDFTNLFLDCTLFDQDLSGWDTGSATAMHGMFSLCPLFNSDISNWDMSGVTDISFMFMWCSAFDQNLGKWDVSQVVNFGDLFNGATSFNGTLATWDTSSATSMTGVFSGAVLFNQDIGDWDTSHVEAMGGMFSGATAFNTDVTTWDTSSVTDMTWMFNDAAAFSQDLTTWCVELIPSLPNGFKDDSQMAAEPYWGSSCTDMGMEITGWYDASDLSTLWGDVGGTVAITTAGDTVMRIDDLSGNENHMLATGSPAVLRVDDASLGYLTIPHDSVFSASFESDDYTVITSIPTIGLEWESPLMGTDGQATVVPLKTVPHEDADHYFGAGYVVQGSTLNTRNQDTVGTYLATNVAAYAITGGLDMSNYYRDDAAVPTLMNWVTTGINNTAYMFASTTFNQDVGAWDTSNITNMSGMFYDAATFNQDIRDWTMDAVTNTSLMFFGADDFDSVISDWVVTAVTDMTSMFEGASSFDRDISSWGVGEVTTMDAMFLGASSFNQSLAGWDTVKVGSMHSMFTGATSFDSLVTFTDVSNVHDMHGMFSGCTVFNQDLSTWDIGEVNDMTDMFNGAVAFTGASIDNWDVSEVIGMSGMFEGAALFVGTLVNWTPVLLSESVGMFKDAVLFNGDINTWDVSALRSATEMFNGATIFNQDLRYWCVEDIEDYADFAVGSSLTVDNTPSWGNCPIRPFFYARYDPSVLTSLFTSAVGGAQANTTGDSVRRIEDLSGNGHHMTTTDTGGLLRVDSDGKHYIECTEEATWTVVIPTDDVRIVRSVPGIGVECDTVVTAGNSVRLINITSNASTREMGAAYMIGTATATEVERQVMVDLLKVNASAYTFNSFRSLANYFNNESNVPELFDWDLSNINTLRGMFQNASSFNQDLGGWDTSNVTTMALTFSNCLAFNGSVDNWKVEKVTTFNQMFYNCSLFNQPMLNWKFGAVCSDVSVMLARCPLFNQNLDTWDVSELTSFSEMFDGCWGFNGTLAGWETTSATNMYKMFDACSVFNQSIAHFDTDLVTDMGRMFSGCPRYNKPMPFWNASSCTNMDNMFNDGTDLNQSFTTWCVPLILSVPTKFVEDTAMLAGTNPVWGTCPTA